VNVVPEDVVSDLNIRILPDTETSFDHKSRIDYRDRNELMMSDLDAREALMARRQSAVSWTAFCMFLQKRCLVSGPAVSPAFTVACPTRMAENLVVEIMTLRGPAMATRNAFLTLRIDTILRTPV